MSNLTPPHGAAELSTRTESDDILNRLYAEQRLARLNQTFLNFTANALDNINLLTACCGELLQADCALYNRIADNRLTVVGSWHAPPDLPAKDAAHGRICCDVVNTADNRPWLLGDLLHSSYAATDPNIIKYGLQTYFGKAVSLDQKHIGSLCAVYRRDITPTCQDESILNIIAAAIAVEEERYRAEQERQQSLAMTSATLEATREGILVVDTAGHPIRMNHAFCNLWQLATDAPQSRDRETRCQQMATMLEAGAAPPFLARIRFLYAHFSIEALDTLRLKDGRIIERFTYPLRVDGSIAGRIWSFRDVTLQHRAMRELIDARERAESASSAKSEFLARMSHEIRNPLNGVIGFSHLLQDTNLDDQQREQVELICASADNVLGVINDILDFSKIEAGKIHLENEIFPLATVITEAVNSQSCPAKAKGLELAASLDERLPRYVSGDPLRLKQIIINLISNAIKFTAHGSVILTADATPQHNGQISLDINVQDTGIGIPPEQHEAIFHDYTQANGSTSRLFGGTGLGLPICRKLATLMGGRIWVESSPGAGSIFRVSILVGQAETLAQDVPLQTAKAAALHCPPLTTLLAEDEVINRRFMTVLLGKLGCSVTAVENGQQALETWRQKKFDLVLMDIQMPVMDGLEAIRLLRGEEENRELPRTPAIALTAHAMQGYRETLLKAGMDGYVTKPVTIPTLLTEIERVRSEMDAPCQTT